jgi:uncharacterized protein
MKMNRPNPSPRGKLSRTSIAIAGISLALLLPAQAQFWDWGGRPQRQQGGWGWGGGGWERERGGGGGFFDFRPAQPQREVPVDFSRAPPPEKKKAEATTNILVVGDANADWLAYGLEDAFSDKPELGVVRRHRTDSGLIRYGGRGDVEWPQAVREIITAEKPKFIVMMIGNNDRQQIREKAPPVTRPGAPKAAAGQQQPATPAPATSAPAPAPDPERQAPEASETAETPPPANLTPEQARIAAYGPWEFHTEKWELAYIKRIDATIAALKSAGVPVVWVGLPSQRNPKPSADSSYLNEIYRSRAEKAGIVYVDIWDGFVDESGRFSPQGPDYEGQIRRLRSPDGLYYTKFGARKIALYVEREVQRFITNQGVPVALPVPEAAPAGANTKSSGGSQRPVAGPVVPLTSAKVVQEDLVGGGRQAARPAAGGDAAVSRVLVRGEAVPAPTGRADDFSWPRGSAAIVEPTEPLPPEAMAPATDPKAAAKPGQQQRTATTTDAQGQGGQAAPADQQQRPAAPRQRPVQQRYPSFPLFNLFR